MTQEPFREETIDLKRLVFKYMRFWYWFVISIAIAIAIGYFINKFAESRFSVKSSVLIRDDRRGGFRPSQASNFMQELEIFNPRTNIYNEMAVLSSYALVDSAIKKLDLNVSYYNIGRLVGEIRTTEIYHSSPFVVHYDTADINLINRSFNVKILSEKSFEIEASDN
ncbi:MAG: hypothetical protein R6U11_07270, partial [Bacteroidales bacterium]